MGIVQALGVALLVLLEGIAALFLLVFTIGFVKGICISIVKAKEKRKREKFLKLKKENDEAMKYIDNLLIPIEKFIEDNK